jgi:hypothetical protein
MLVIAFSLRRETRPSTSTGENLHHTLTMSLTFSQQDELEIRATRLSERKLQNPNFISLHKPLETLELRGPYRIRAVQSSGENAPFGED